MSLAFFPGSPPDTPRLLARFLPPLAEGVAAYYLQRFSRPGDLIFDPFGLAPNLALEALALDRRVLVAGFNPVMRLALSLAVRPPAIADLRLALTRLGDVTIGRVASDRLEHSIRALYQTRCAECEAVVTADYFDWDAEAGEPVEKGYVCHNCGGPRQAPTDAADREAARRYTRNGPDYHYLLGRVAVVNDPDRADAEEALQVYPARTLSAIGSVLVKLEGLDLDRDSDRLLAGPLIAAFDLATSLAQERPRVLSVPRRYREVNFWLALEHGLGLVAGLPLPDRSISLEGLLAQRKSAGGAIHAYTGPVRELAARLPARACQLMISALPRPNQAFWTLSALWTAWLWGPAAAEPLRAVLRRRRYDWHWHARALERTLTAVQPALAPAGHFIGLLAEAEPGFTAAALAGASAAGLRLLATALRADTAEVQVDWQIGPTLAPGDTLSPDEQTARAVAAMLAALRARGEPSRWATLHWAASAALSGRVPAEDEEVLPPSLRAIEAAAQATSLARLGAEAGDDLGTGLWWLSAPAQAQAPLADRVEAEVLRLLSDGAPVAEREVLPAVCAAFAGAQTPGQGLVLACLASYAQRVDDGAWQLRSEDAAAVRAADLQATIGQLQALAARLQLTAAGDGVQWWLEGGRLLYAFAVQPTANLAGVLLAPPPTAERRRCLVLPGGRVALAEYKLRRDPRLRAAFQAGGWIILKYRHVRRMATDFAVTRTTLEAALAGDPVQPAAAQQLALPE